MLATFSDLLREVVEKQWKYTLPDTEGLWEYTQDAERGDCSTSIALRLSKALSMSPRDIATAIATAMESHPLIARVEVAGAGYVNVWLTEQALLDWLEKEYNALTPVEPDEQSDPVIIEYSQPNIAKPLGAHHIIGTLIGQSLVHMHRHAGDRVIAWNYLGDWGTQFGKLAVAHSKWGDKPASAYSVDELLALYVRFHQEAESDPALEEQGRAAFRRLEQGDAALRSFWADVVQVTKDSLSKLYERLHVSFDVDFGESFYEDKMDDILQRGEQKGVFRTGEHGSLIVQFPEESGLPPYLVRKGDGATLYSTRDIAQMRYRIDHYHPRAIFILTDIAQKLHFEQLIATCQQLEWDLPYFDNVLFGRMRFADKSMSTRKGQILKMEHLLDEAVERAAAVIRERGDAIQTDDPDALAEMIGVGAVAYGVLSQSRTNNIIFDWDRMLSFDGNSAPYLQYTHARACSVLRKADSHTETIDPQCMTAHDRLLLLCLVRFSAVLEDSRTSRMPHKLAQYLFELSQQFNSFYAHASILQSDPAERALRLQLVQHTADVLRVGGALLTLRMPERM